MRAEARGILRRLGIALLYLAAWEAVSVLVGKAYLVPSPFVVFSRFGEILLEGDSWAKAGMTLGRILLGYALGIALGVALGVLTASFSAAETLLSPLRGIVRATPVTSIILLAILLMTSGQVPVFISFLMVLPIIWTNTAEAIRRTDRGLVEMGRAFGFSHGRMLRLIWIPSVQPGLIAASTTALGFAWKSGIAAEILSQPKRSVGYMLYVSKLTLEAVDLFAWTLLIVLLSMALEALVTRFLRRLRHD